MGFFTDEASAKAGIIIGKAKKNQFNDKEARAALIARIEASLEEKALKDGLKLMRDPREGYKAYKILGVDHGIGIGIKMVEPTDENGLEKKARGDRCKMFRFTVCFCNKSDYNKGYGWDDDLALSLLGKRFIKGEWEPREFPVNVDVHVVAKAIHTSLLDKGYLCDSNVPYFFSKLLLRSDGDLAFRGMEIE